LKRVIESTSNEGDLVMDFFLGSGTTTAVAHKLKRRWIGVEMGEHFYTVVLPRMKKVLAYDKSGISKEVKEYYGGGFFKYQELEQYEDALNNTVFREIDGTVQKKLEEMEDYFINFMLDYETAGSPCKVAIEKFNDPFNYKLKILRNGQEKDTPVDMVETFNYLIGLDTHKIHTFVNEEDGRRKYYVVSGNSKVLERNVVIIWRNTENINLDSDHNFIKNVISPALHFSPEGVLFFVNGDCKFPNTNIIEKKIQDLL
ncbi:MAG: site-specific DNA-methyltransferase, partial [Nitrososphaeria archaeon]